VAERRLFLLPGACLDSAPQSLPAEEAHHVLHVLRLRPGAVIGILDGCGQEGTAEIASAAGGRVLVRVTALGPGAREPVRPVVVAAGLVRGPRWDCLIEKATELGATHIAPLAASRSVVRGARPERWRKVALAAAKQSLRARIPEVAAPLPLADVLSAWSEALILVACEGGGSIGEPPASAVSPLLLVVGPEGGLTDAESEILRASGAREVTLGPRRLRAETAVASLLSLARPLFDRGVV
jgi:16S rRNA (uracil1498-N3)-methyltransferase